MFNIDNASYDSTLIDVVERKNHMIVYFAWGGGGGEQNLV